LIAVWNGGGLDPREGSYGSDRIGLVWGFRFLPGAPAEVVSLESATSEEVRDLVAAPGAFLWLHFSLANNAAAAWMRDHLDLPEAFHESLHEEIGSTRLEQEDESLVAVVHDVLFDFGFDPKAISTAILALGPRSLVSARLKPLRSIDRLRERVRAGGTFASPSELFAQLLLYQAHGLVDIARQATSRVNAIEDGLLEKRLAWSRGELGALRRVLVRLQRLLAPEPTALFRLLSRPPSWIRGSDLQEMRQAAEEFSAAVSDSVALAERIRLLQEEVGAQVNEQTNRTLFLLTVVTVLALPINMAAGLFGMNVGGIPWAHSPHGFAFVVVVLATTTGALSWWFLGRRRE